MRTEFGAKNMKGGRKTSVSVISRIVMNILFLILINSVCRTVVESRVGLFGEQISIRNEKI